MLCLGIESTAHTFACSVIEQSGSKFYPNVLSDVRDIFKAPEGSGIHPREAARHHAAVAIDDTNNRTAGCVLLLGDGASFYYVKDMMVHPDYQSKHVGTALMHQLNLWLETNAVPDALVGLYTGENLAPFYRQFGFVESFGMCKRTAG